MQVEPAPAPPIPVRWYFVDGRDDFLPPNPWGSRNWLPDPDQTFPLGEVAGASREWVDGSPPPAIPGVVPPGCPFFPPEGQAFEWDWGPLR
jgi:hypothetical protein